ncbi:tripartite tricarboxylate transporter TctB family protein [Nitratireductor sp. CH_MIT9313-5]|uniref:tripartite tricarboxylate transporter TctB family protein n=1 Tax=Nitratireductor sp. CH_MIT9313-5 TaxID=3107764 RepID=UPI0030098EDC
MDNKQIQTRLGIGAMALSLFLILAAIPNWVSEPSNVPHLVLSPTFWPYTLSALMGLTGLGLFVTGLSQSAGGAVIGDPIPDSRKGYLRLAAMGLVMIAAMFLMSRLGMVWTSMLLFIASIVILRTRYPIAALICAISVPLVLYAFFAHVAGVAIPQGDFVRLP